MSRLKETIYLLAVVGAFIAGGTGTWAQIVKESGNVVDALKPPSESTMAGSGQLKLNTNEFFAGFQLLGKDPVLFDSEQLTYAPVIMPKGTDVDQAFICVRYLSRNTRYSASVNYEVALPVSEMSQVGYLTEPSRKIREEGYTDREMLARVQLTDDCGEAYSNIFIPVALTPEPEMLFVVFEIGDARLAPVLRHVGDETALDNAFACEPSRMVDFGYDCTISLENLESGLYQIDVAVTLGEDEPVTLTALVTLP
jgi:hypothetical protein